MFAADDIFDVFMLAAPPLRCFIADAMLPAPALSLIFHNFAADTMLMPVRRRYARNAERDVGSSTHQRR